MRNVCDIYFADSRRSEKGLAWIDVFCLMTDSRS